MAMKNTPQFLKIPMRKIFLTIGAGLVLSSVSTLSSQAAGPAMMKLHGHVPAIVSQLKADGIVSADTNLSLAIGLPLRNREALTNLLAEKIGRAHV